MPINFKDLLVTVLPKSLPDAEQAKLCKLWTKICINPTICVQGSCFRGSLGCDFNITLCKPCSLLGTCGICSVQGTGGCGFFHSCGGPGGSACNPTYFDPIVIQHREDLVSLKAELQATLKSLDALQKELPSAIGTKTDAEALEKGLTDALEQVRAAKKNL